MKEFLQTFFEGIGIAFESLDVTVLNEDLNIVIKTSDSSLLIGQHGKNMESLKHLIGRIAEKQLGKFVHVHLEVNDYMKSKEERLIRFLDSKVVFVTSTGKSIRIPNLSSYERKLAHNYISEKNMDGLSTHSEGEGGERALIMTYTGPIKETPRWTRDTSDLDLLSEDGIGI